MWLLTLVYFPIHVTLLDFDHLTEIQPVKPTLSTDSIGKDACFCTCNQKAIWTNFVPLLVFFRLCAVEMFPSIKLQTVDQIMCPELTATKR